MGGGRKRGKTIAVSHRARLGVALAAWGNPEVAG